MDTTPTTPTTSSPLDGSAGVTIGDYVVPLDPMDDLGCDSCQ